MATNRLLAGLSIADLESIFKIQGGDLTILAHLKTHIKLSLDAKSFGITRANSQG